MGRQEPGGMIAGTRIRGIGAVAIQTLGPSVARSAALRAGRRQLRVIVGEVYAVRLGALPLHPRPWPSAGSRGMHGQRRCGRCLMAAETAFLRVTRGAPGSFPPCRIPVAEKKGRFRVARRGTKLRPDRQGSGIGLKCLNGGHLRGVDVALGTVVARMTGCTINADR